MSDKIRYAYVVSDSGRIDRYILVKETKLSVQVLELGATKTIRKQTDSHTVCMDRKAALVAHQQYCEKAIAWHEAKLHEFRKRLAMPRCSNIEGGGKLAGPLGIVGGVNPPAET